ncbi:unnamed protein product [Lathyrus sativus]|nr:unnamed protein product [Lathyrus sativus]
MDSEGVIQTDHQKIEEEILKFYKDLVGKSVGKLKSINLVDLRNGPQLNNDQRDALSCSIFDAKIKTALYGIHDNTAPGIDGFGAKFFKASWDIIKEDLGKAVREFFGSSCLLNAMNCTLVTLIPKVNNATMIKDYRPISCCTTLYKVISKIMANRLSKVLNSIIDNSQAAFVPGNHIQDHILLAFELIKGYNTNGAPPRCMIQMGLQKANDTIEWCALEAIMKEMSFPQKFIN